MNRFEKRKIKTGLYRHVNALTYVCIFTVASIITIAAAVNRTDDIIHIDESQAMVNESVAFNNKDAQKVAAGKSTTETVTEDNAQTQVETTEAQTEAATTAKKATKKENNVYVQFQGMEFDTAAIEAAVKADYTAKNGKKTMSSVSIYIKPEDMKAYYVIDGIIGDVAL